MGSLNCVIKSPGRFQLQERSEPGTQTMSSRYHFSPSLHSIALFLSVGSFLCFIPTTQLPQQKRKKKKKASSSHYVLKITQVWVPPISTSSHTHPCSEGKCSKEGHIGPMQSSWSETFPKENWSAITPNREERTQGRTKQKISTTLGLHA